MQSTSNCSNKFSESEDPDKALVFSKSKAASWSDRSSFSGRNHFTDYIPWYQPFSISASIGAVLIWFCILREESDVDKELGKSLYERIDGLEKKQLELSLIHNRSTGKDTKAIQERLDEINSKG